MTDSRPGQRPKPRLLLVTGMSGAGKSTVLDGLEDMGWDCVENLTVSMLKDYAEQGLEGGRHVPIAVGMDVRSRGFNPAALPDIVQSIDGVSPEILYLDCSGAELIRRYDETRRLHPLAPDRPAEDGIARERTFTARLRSEADSVLDTTDLMPAELRDELRPLTGEDAKVRAYIEQDESWSETMDRIEALLIDWIPRYWAAGKTYLTVAFGCTGGRHRSVCAAVEMAERLRRAGFSPNVRHRDLASRPSDTVEGSAGRGPVGGELSG